MKYSWLLKFSNEFFEKYKQKIKQEVGLFSDKDIERDTDLWLKGLKSGKYYYDVVKAHEALLLKHDIVPVEFNGKNSLVGKSTALVYSVIYEGKDAVAKISTSSYDIEIMQKLHNLKEKLPDKYKKHIAKVFLSFKDGINYIAVVERLNPLNTHIMELMKANYDERFLNFALEIFNKELLKELGKILFDDDLHHVYNFFLDQNKKYKNVIFPANYSRLEKIRSEILSKFKFTQRILNDNILDNFEEIRSIYTDLFNKTLISNFPIQHNEEDLVYSEIPETAEFLSFLRYLKENFNIQYYDLHEDNIMERPKTRDLVIADPGMFIIT